MKHHILNYLKLDTYREHFGSGVSSFTCTGCRGLPVAKGIGKERQKEYVEGRGPLN